MPPVVWWKHGLQGWAAVTLFRDFPEHQLPDRIRKSEIKWKKANSLLNMDVFLPSKSCVGTAV